MRNPYTKPLSELQGPTIDIEGFRNFGDICIVGKSSKKLVHSTVDSPTPLPSLGATLFRQSFSHSERLTG